MPSDSDTTPGIHVPLHPNLNHDCKIAQLLPSQLPPHLHLFCHSSLLVSTNECYLNTMDATQKAALTDIIWYKCFIKSVWRPQDCEDDLCPFWDFQAEDFGVVCGPCVFEMVMGEELGKEWRWRIEIME